MTQSTRRARRAQGVCPVPQGRRASFAHGQHEMRVAGNTDDMVILFALRQDPMDLFIDTPHCIPCGIHGSTISRHSTAEEGNLNLHRQIQP